jgi:hypothetical protein
MRLIPEKNVCFIRIERMKQLCRRNFNKNSVFNFNKNSIFCPLYFPIRERDKKEREETVQTVVVVEK